MHSHLAGLLTGVLSIPHCTDPQHKSQGHVKGLHHVFTDSSVLLPYILELIVIENKYYNDGVQQDSRQKIQASSDFSLSSYITPPGHRPVV